jgi:hypothetical protein
MIEAAPCPAGLPHLVLLQLVAAEDDQSAGPMVAEHGCGKPSAERTGAASDQDGFVC